MIIVKTKNGDHFINDKAGIKVEHNKERATVTCYAEKGIYSYMENVEQVVYISDAQPVEWKDDGSEIQRLKTELVKKNKEYSQLCVHFSYLREWFMIYEEAIISIKEQSKRAERENKGIYVSPLAIIEAAEKKYKESEEKFEEARKKWEK